MTKTSHHGKLSKREKESTDKMESLFLNAPPAHCCSSDPDMTNSVHRLEITSLSKLCMMLCTVELL